MKAFVIAEVGINHNGSLQTALDLMDIAKDAGCDAVKFQKRSITRVYTEDELNKYRESPWGTTNREQKLGLELSKTQYDTINEYAKTLRIEWFASAWDLESIEFLKQYNLKYNKIASAMLGHTKFLNEIAMQRKHTFISTGMANYQDIRVVTDIFDSWNCPYELMLCHAQYPAPDEQANLKCIQTLKDMFKCNVGYSDHTTGIILSVAAVALGATSIEKHITLDRAMYGSDQSASLEPQGLNKMLEYIRWVEKSLGDGIKVVTDGEFKVKAKLYRTGDN